MSKQKVWVEKMPEYCDDCPCSLRGKDDCAYCNLLHKNIGYDFGKRPKHCPLHSIKDYNRELVRQMCEKIEDWCDKNFNLVSDGIGYDGQDYNEMIGSNKTINKLRGFLDQIQKEFEK